MSWRGSCLPSRILGTVYLNPTADNVTTFLGGLDDLPPRTEGANYPEEQLSGNIPRRLFTRLDHFPSDSSYYGDSDSDSNPGSDFDNDR